MWLLVERWNFCWCKGSNQRTPHQKSSIKTDDRQSPETLMAFQGRDQARYFQWWRESSDQEGIYILG